MATTRKKATVLTVNTFGRSRGSGGSITVRACVISLAILHSLSKFSLRNYNLFFFFHHLLGYNAQTDLFELWPSDGYVNGLRGNYPLGNVSSSAVTYLSTNGCKIGTCAAGSEYGKCFEVTDALKGDIARSYFYLSTAYWNEWECCDEGRRISARSLNALPFLLNLFLILSCAL